jgi:hypothetical protein
MLFATMCNRCRVEATGLRSGKGPSIFSKLLGLRACKHKPECNCSDCNSYRDRNSYADFGLTGKREIKER